MNADLTKQKKETTYQKKLTAEGWRRLLLKNKQEQKQKQIKK